MARSRKNDTFEMLWLVLVVLPALFGFWLGFQVMHSVLAAALCAGLGAGLGIAILVVWRFKQEDKLKRSGIREIDQMDGVQFEHYLGHLFKSQGFHTEVTRASGDYGADLVITKDNKRIVV